MNIILFKFEHMKKEQDHFEVLRKIDKNPNFSQRQLAEKLGFSPAINYLKFIKKV